MVLKLYGSAMATARVLVVLLEKKLPYEFHPIDLEKGEQRSAEFMQLQPFGKVPVLKDNDFVVFESRAICRYLAKKYPSGPHLLPDSDDTAYARFEQACSVEQSYFAAAAESLGFELVIKPKQGLGEPDAAIIARAEEDLDVVLAYYNGVLAKQRYIAGNELTLADLFHLPNSAALMAGKWPVMFQKYPYVLAWFTGLQSRETWQKAAGEAKTFV